jgi:hypothetical protein
MILRLFLADAWALNLNLVAHGLRDLVSTSTPTQATKAGESATTRPSPTPSNADHSIRGEGAIIIQASD